jgi:hypothetical protein
MVAESTSSVPVPPMPHEQNLCRTLLGRAPVRGVAARPQGPSVLLRHPIRPLSLAARLPGQGRGGWALAPAGALRGGAPWAIPVASLPPRSAPPRGAGRVRPRRRQAARRCASLPCAPPSVGRPRRPGPWGGGRRPAQATGTTRVPAPRPTRSRPPARPSPTRVGCPLHHGPPHARGLRSGRTTASSRPHVQGQRRRVASRLVSMGRHSDPRTS